MAENIALGPVSVLESVNLKSRRTTLFLPPAAQEFIGSLFSDASPLYDVNESQFERLAFAGPAYTIWWVNTPLTIGDNVKVLTFLASVNGSRIVDLGALGRRMAWTLSTGFETTVPDPMCVGTDGCTVKINGVSFDAAFEYDQTSGELLASNFDLQSSNDLQTYHSSTGSAYWTTSGSTLRIHASLRLVSEDNGWISTTWVNPPKPPPSGNGDQNPTASRNPPATLLGEITIPRTLASVSALVLVIGFAGLFLVRRSRRNQLS